MLIALFGSRCTNTTNDNSLEFNEADTVKLVQTVLADSELETEIIKDFGNQQLKFIKGFAIKTDQKFTFSGKPVRIVTVEENIYQIRMNHPKELYVSVPTVKFITKDSAVVSLIFHAGNATALFNLENEENNWVIRNRQYGKF